MVYPHVCKASFGNLYLRLYADRGNHYIVLTGSRGEPHPVDPFQTRRFYIVFFCAAGDLEHEQDGQPIGRMNEEQRVDCGEVFACAVVVVDLELRSID